MNWVNFSAHKAQCCEITLKRYINSMTSVTWSNINPKKSEALDVLA